MDRQLIAAFLETKSYPAWSRNQSNSDWNIGLENIDNFEVEKTSANRDALTHGLVATLDGVQFRLTGSLKSTCMPDGELFTHQTVWLHIGEDCVLEAAYSVHGLDACIPEDFSLFSVDEYHESQELEQLLSRISDLVQLKQRKLKEKRQQEQAERYKGKFSFGDD
ncbi:hypothetical protein WI88_13415 [Burkholderia ubonensis]|nr:hypothetical protein WI88_13415 [Burkholderia ubonensis]